MTDKETEPGFDEKLSALEKLVMELEQGDLGLEDSLASYKRGVELLKSCRTQLSGYQAQVQELLADAGGETKPLEGDPDAGVPF